MHGNNDLSRTGWMHEHGMRTARRLSQPAAWIALTTSVAVMDSKFGPIGHSSLVKHGDRHASRYARIGIQELFKRSTCLQKLEENSNWHASAEEARLATDSVVVLPDEVFVNARGRVAHEWDCT